LAGLQSKKRVGCVSTKSFELVRFAAQKRILRAVFVGEVLLERSSAPHSGIRSQSFLQTSHDVFRQRLFDSISGNQPRNHEFPCV